MSGVDFPCEPARYCSFSDAGCTSGWRYGTYSGEGLGDQCVPELQRAPSTCGNGVVEARAECDDGNTQDNDGCRASCRWASCGDGVVRSGVEECDDGNTADLDGCTSRCVACAPSPSRTTSGGHCYWPTSTFPLSTTDAANLCSGSGGYLATLASMTEQLELRIALNLAQTP
jgi:cysteine-rich repeat protein